MVNGRSTRVTTRRWTVALCAGAMALVTAGVVAQQESGPAPKRPSKEAMQQASRLYGEHCAACHGVAGDSPLPDMNFADGVWRHGTTVKAVSDVIRNGVPNTAMTAFKNTLREPEIEALAWHVRALDPKLAKASK